MTSKIPRSEFSERLKALQGRLRERGYEWAIVYSLFQERDGHVAYLTNHKISFPMSMGHMGLGYSAYLVPLDGPGILVSPFGYEEERVVNVASVITSPNLVDGIVQAFSELRLRGKGAVIGEDVMPVEYHERALRRLGLQQLPSATQELEAMRSVKSEAEVSVLKEAAALGSKALSEASGAVKPGIDEAELAAELVRLALELGADQVLRVRVASGRRIRSTLTWPMFSRREVENGDAVFVDFIGMYSDYAFDIQTVYLTGQAEAEMKRAIETANDALDWMSSSIRPGQGVRLVRAYGRGFRISPFGHGIGLEVVENPLLLEGSSAAIMPGMVLCLEPTVYGQQVGELGFEEMFLVEQGGVRRLSSSPRPRIHEL